MDTKQVILELRTQKGMSQDELAEKVFVSRQAVSRWENGETVPNTETLKLLSKVFDVSINTLLGSPRKLICQCCGMPLEDDDIIGHNHDGSFNEDYCKWCYADGTYTYNDMDDLIEVCVKNMVSENFTEEQARSYMKELLPTLDYWKKYDELSDNGQFEEFKKKLINEINELNVDGMPKVEKLNALVDKYPVVAARRGKGFMQGLVIEGTSVGSVVTKALENGLLVISAGSDVLRLVPPLIITKEHIDEMIEKLEKSLA